MGKGTPAQGKRQKTLHIRCRRCGRHSYHIRKKACSSCGFGDTAKMRSYAWAKSHRV